MEGGEGRCDAVVAQHTGGGGYGLIDSMRSSARTSLCTVHHVFTAIQSCGCTLYGTFSVIFYISVHLKF